MDMLHYQLRPDTAILREQRAEECAAILERTPRSLNAWPFPGSRVRSHYAPHRTGMVLESYSTNRRLVATVLWDTCPEPHPVGIIDLDIEPGSCRD